MNAPWYLALLFAAGSAVASGTPEQLVRDYFAGADNGVPGDELVATFWMPTLVIVGRGSPASQIPAVAFADLLDRFRADQTSKGRKRTQINRVESCILRDDLALVSVEYEYQYESGGVLPEAVIYTLSKGEQWRLSSVTPVDINVPIRCD